MEGTKESGKDLFNIKREVDSVDDFEHLGHDSSPLQDLLGLKPDKEVTAPETVHEIDITPKTAVSHHTGSSDFAPNPIFPEKMNRNLLEDDFLGRGEGVEKLDSFLQDSTVNHPTTVFDIGHNKQSSFNLIEAERLSEPVKKNIDQFLDFEDHHEKNQPKDDLKFEDFGDAFKYEHIPEKPLIPDISSVPHIPAPEKNVIPPVISPAIPDKKLELQSENRPEPLTEKKSEIQPDKSQIQQGNKPELPQEKKPEPLQEKRPEPLQQKKPESLQQKKPEPPQEKKAEPAQEEKSELEKPAKKIEENKKLTNVTSAKIAPPDAAAIFCKMGLDAWFNPEKLDPKVESLIYWRDPKKSGPVFGGVLVVLLALTYFSLISVVAYLSLISLAITIAFRIYKNIVQAVQKTGDGHPFKDLLELDVSLPQEKVKEITEVAVAHINAAVVELRRLFLVEDLVDSIKFGVLLWTLTYVGAWFNGMTLIILAWVALFTLPKVYETNKTQIDANLETVRTKLAEITSKIKAAIPMGKKTEEKKEQ